MAIDEKLTIRVRELIAAHTDNIEEKKMFGGICFMVNGKMFMGVQVDHLMVRINPNMQEEALSKDGCSPMEMGSKSFKGFVFVDTGAVTTKAKLDYWVTLAMEYNPIAPASKKKGK